MSNLGIDPVAQPCIDRYEVPPREVQRAQRLRSFVGNRKFKRCLDLGCGNGFITRFFVDCCEEIYGLDRPEKIEYIKKIIPKGNFVPFNLGIDTFGEKVPPIGAPSTGGYEYLIKTFGIGRFDLIIFTDVLSYLTNRAIVVGQIFNMLEDSGILLVSQHAPHPPDRKLHRDIFELAGFWLLREEYYQPSTFWILQAFTRYPPLTNLPINGELV